MKIVSAVTTSPRPGVSYLEATLASLQNAGFAPEIVRDEERRGSFWVLREALTRLLERQADCYCVFQDDVVCAKGAAAWLEGQLWPLPEEQVGILSLYTASVCHLRPGWFTADEMPVVRPWGALALVFPRHFAEKVLARTDRAMLTGSDTTLSGMCRQFNLAWFNHSPSLIEHVGEVSAIHVREVGLDEHRRAGLWCRDVAELTTPE